MEKQIIKPIKPVLIFYTSSKSINSHPGPGSDSDSLSKQSVCLQQPSSFSSHSALCSTKELAAQSMASESSRRAVLPCLPPSSLSLPLLTLLLPSCAFVITDPDLKPIKPDQLRRFSSELRRVWFAESWCTGLGKETRRKLFEFTDPHFCLLRVNKPLRVYQIILLHFSCWKSLNILGSFQSIHVQYYFYSVILSYLRAQFFFNSYRLNSLQLPSFLGFYLPVLGTCLQSAFTQITVLQTVISLRS